MMATPTQLYIYTNWFLVLSMPINTYTTLQKLTATLRANSEANSEPLLQKSPVSAGIDRYHTPRSCEHYRHHFLAGGGKFRDFEYLVETRSESDINRQSSFKNPGYFKNPSKIQFSRYDQKSSDLKRSRRAGFPKIMKKIPELLWKILCTFFFRILWK